MSSFFRVLLGDYTTKLRIPPLFVSRFSSLTPKTVILVISSSRRLWTVGIEEEDKELYFKRGWDIFVEDNALETAELIVFKLYENSTFKVDIYGKASASMFLFCRVLIGEYTKLQIPVLFISRYSSLAPQSVRLVTTSSNKSWTVDIEEENKALYFKRGWSTFVKDNAFETEQFVLFKFIGNSTFKVKIYGRSACEKGLENQPCINQNYCIQHHHKQTTTQDQREEDPNDDHDNSNQENGSSLSEVEEEHSNEIDAIQPESHDPIKEVVHSNRILQEAYEKQETRGRDGDSKRSMDCDITSPQEKNQNIRQIQ